MISSGDTKQGHVHPAFNTSFVYQYVDFLLHGQRPGLSV